MQLFFIVLSFAGLGYFAMAKRIFDWHSVAFASACVYFLPGYVGYTHVREDYRDLDLPVYCIMCGILAAILAGAVIHDRRQSTLAVLTPGHYSLLPEATCLLATLAFCIAVTQTGVSLLSSDKQEMLSNFTRWHLIWRVGSTVAFVLAITNRRWLLIAISGLLLLATWYAGIRSAVAIAVIGLVTQCLMERGRTPLVANRKMCLTILVFACLVFGYKRVYNAVKLGDFQHVYAIVSDDSFIADSIQHSEPFVTTHILNIVVAADFRADGFDHFYGIVNSTIGQTELGYPVSFGDKFIMPLFGELSFGMASNIWAEMYSTGGYPMLAAFTAIFVAFLGYTSSLSKSLVGDSRAALFAWMPYCTFYLHRNDVYRLLSFMKQHLVVLLIAGTAAWLLRPRSTPPPVVRHTLRASAAILNRT